MNFNNEFIDKKDIVQKEYEHIIVKKKPPEKNFKIMEQNEMQQRAMDQRMMDNINSGSLAPMTSPRPRARPMR